MWLQASAVKWLKTALFWVITHRVLVISYRRFGTTYRFHLQELRHLKIESPETSTRIYHYSLRINPKERSSQVVHRFHQTRKGAHVTKKFKNQCSIGSDKCSCTRSTCWFLYPRQANTRPILPAFLHSRYTKILQKNLFVKKNLSKPWASIWFLPCKTHLVIRPKFRRTAQDPSFVLVLCMGNRPQIL